MHTPLTRHQEYCSWTGVRYRRSGMERPERPTKINSSWLPNKERGKEGQDKFLSDHKFVRGEPADETDGDQHCDDGGKPRQGFDPLSWHVYVHPPNAGDEIHRDEDRTERGEL